MRARKSQERTIVDLAHKEAVGGRLRVTREALGARRLEWCKRYGLSPSQISMIESGRHYPDLQFLIALCEDYGVTLDWFYRGLAAVGPLSLPVALDPARGETSLATAAKRRRLGYADAGP